MAAVPWYPVRVRASLDPALSRGLWLVKWLLAIPHYLVLSLLWPVFGVLTVVAFFAILVTGRYPRGVFDFNVGVLRWTWRVHYYAYAALGTDRYPPFTLADVSDYPAGLEVDYPERLSRGLVLVKWWLLAIPHYLVAGLFVGGGLWFLRWSGDDDATWAGGGLVGILVLVAGVVLLFTGRYPQPIYDFVLGMDRWVVRVAVYAGLMTDQYPPFRLDLGGGDPADEPDGPVPPATRTGAGARPAGWTPGRITAVVLGSVLVLMSMGLLTGGAAMLWADRTQRDTDGYLTTSGTFGTGTYALVTERIALHGQPADWMGTGLGDVRVRVIPTDPDQAVFLGIAPSGRADGYLAGSGYATIRQIDGDTSTVRTVQDGGPPLRPPEATDIWLAESSGTGTRSVNTSLGEWDWTVVVLNTDRSAGVSVRAEAGATMPALPWAAGGVLALGAILLAAGGLLIGRAAHLASGSEPVAYGEGSQHPPDGASR